MKNIRLGNLIIGDGTVKICMPISGRTEKEVLLEANAVKAAPCDLAEWRADLWNEGSNKEKTAEMLHHIKAILVDKPILFTYRTVCEGGEGDRADRYFELLENAAASGCAGTVDVEFSKEAGRLNTFLDFARQRGVITLLSKHIFEGTPDKTEMLKTLCAMQEMGADIIKLAVMNNSREDAERVISTAKEMLKNHAKVPFVLIGMGEFGKVTRLIHPYFGSALTYAKGALTTGPGQLSIEELLSAEGSGIIKYTRIGRK